MIKVKSPTDIILVPVICEHVINFGTPSHFDDKFSRLKKFYSKVLPLQGWEKYDTISLKWNGQLVATKRRKAPQKVETVQYDDDESVDTGTMLAGDDVAPGRTIPRHEGPLRKADPGRKEERSGSRGAEDRSRQPTDTEQNQLKTQYISMEEKYIVALEIGSSKIKGAIGIVDPQGTLSVKAVEEEKLYDGVRYGCIRNVVETAGAIRNVIGASGDARAGAQRDRCLCLGGRTLADGPGHRD